METTSQSNLKNLELTLEEMQHVLCYLNESDIDCEVCATVREKLAAAIIEMVNDVPPELKRLGVVSIERVTERCSLE